MKGVSIKYSLKVLSTYRTELMGLATLLIIICHAPANGVAMPALLDKILRWGGIGVDIFLFCSGLGMYFSIRKNNNWKRWYIHRYLTLFVPFLLFAIPYYLFRMAIDGDDIWHFLGNISTLSFWTRHEGAWFVAMLLPLYLVTPFIARLIDWKGPRIIPTIVLCAFFLWRSCQPTSNEIINNIQMCEAHLPPFFVGYWIGKYVYESYEIEWRWIIEGLVISFILFLCLGFLHFPKYWLLVAPGSMALCIIFYLNPKSLFNYVAFFLGTISLESYLTNIFIPVVLRKIGYLDLMGGFDKGLYLFYFIVVVLGLLLAYWGHQLSSYILNRWK
ncbi:MAG: acyltransferase [Bacteroidales bacterium]|nr:acyltransferase [Bacteroidales bacterium]